MPPSQSFAIGPYQLSPNGDILLIAEVGLAHEGSLGTAHAYIDAAANCGVGAVKFQTHLAEAESTAQEKFRVKVFPQDATRFDYWKRTAFEKSQWLELAAHARERELIFLSSPFSNLAVDWLIECDVPAWKIASGEITNYPMIERMCATGKPLLLSSGMSSWQELDATVNLIRSQQSPFGIFQCTTSYPCPASKWGLNVIAEMRARYDCPVGLSDHSGTTVPGIAAVALGASMLEFHIAFSKQQFGPDSRASLELDQVHDLVQGIKDLGQALRAPIDKDQQAADLAELHGLFTKSVVAAQALHSGHVLQAMDMQFKKPGGGIPANRYQTLVGKTLTRNVEADHFFTDADFLDDPADKSAE